MGTFSGPGLSLINTCAAATEGKSQSFFCRLRSGANYPDWPGLAVRRWLHANAETLNSSYGNAWERCNRTRTVMGYRAQGTVWSNCCSLNGIAVWCFFSFFHWQTDWNLIPWQNVEAEFSRSHFPSCPCTKLDFTKRLRVRKTNMWVCSPCGVEVHSSGRIAVSSLKIRPRPLGLSQYSKWFQSLFKSCRRERSPGEICSTMMIQSVYTEEWKKKKKEIYC